MLRGVRGATTLDNNDREEMMDAVAELLSTIKTENGMDVEDIGAVIFSATADLDAAFPAAAARVRLDWVDVPLFGAQEMGKADDLSRCIRVLILWNTDKTSREIRHIYLREAAKLRPDIAGDRLR